LITRIESGDRAIDPLYPSWTWMGSTAFDMSPEGHWRILLDARYAELVAALKALPSGARTQPPLARALMQADLWAAFDTLRALRPMPGRAAAPEAIQRMDRVAALGPLLGEAIGALALTRGEIAALPDNYAAAVRSGEVPPVFDPGSGWLEVQSSRSHEQAAMDRRVARVFLEPATEPTNHAAWLETLRGGSGDSASAGGAVLVTQVLLIADDGAVVASPLTFDVQLRTRADDSIRVDEYELSRRRLLSEPRGSGFLHDDRLAPAYLPIAGNDLSFATPFTLQGDPIVAPVRMRCAACHSAGFAGFGVLFTFATHGESDAAWQKAGDPPRATQVAARKMAREDYTALRSQLTTVR